MRFRFNLLVNGFVLVSVAVQSATAEALAHAEILNGQGMKIGDADITSTDQGFKILVKAANLSPGEDSIHIHSVRSVHSGVGPIDVRRGLARTLRYFPDFPDFPALRQLRPQHRQARLIDGLEGQQELKPLL